MLPGVLIIFSTETGEAYSNTEQGQVHCPQRQREVGEVINLDEDSFGYWYC